LGDAYVLSAHAEGPRLARLAPLFQRFQEANGLDNEWTIRAVIRFVQSIPYENIPQAESPMGLRSPTATLFQNSGDCDSKSLLGAVLLRTLGVRTAVVTSATERHAILGVLGLSGTKLRAGGENWTLVEMTSERDPGDVSHLGFSPVDPNGAGDWETYPLE
jgi:hypothetical protein